MKRLHRFSVALALLIMAGGHALAQQTCNANIPDSTPTAQFTDHGDATVTDGKTGLMWKRCAEGQTWSGGTCTGTAATYTWQQALQRAKTVNDGGGFAGKTGWRLPNVKELRSIVEERCNSPSINAAIFQNTPAWYFWSASAHAHYSGYAWSVHFYYGSVGETGKGNGGQVRLVRAGQSFDSFDIADGTLTVTKAGSGAGTVFSSPSGIDCGATCSAYFDAGVAVTLAAAPASGSFFTGWSGACTGTGSCTVTMDAPKSVTATFVIPQLTVSRVGNGGGTVTSSPAGINCGGSCAGIFATGSTVTLTATPDATSSFTGWSGSCSGTGTCTVTMDDVKAVTAGFAKLTYLLTVTKEGSGAGTVFTSPSGIDCGSTCSTTYDYGLSVNLAAVPASGSVFSGWSGSGCTGTGICTVTIDATKSVVATFNTVTPNTFALTVLETGTGSGTVNSSPAGIDCGSICTANFNSGTLVTLTATPASGSSFTGWSGEGCSGTGTCTVTMDAAKSVTARFDLTASTADLGVTQSGSPNPAWTDKDLVYTLTVTNGGPAVATGVTLTDALPAGPTFVWATPGCANASGTVTCTIGTLANGASARVMLVVRPSAAGSITNTATVSATEVDLSLANNDSSSTLTVNATPVATLALRYRLYSPVTLEHHFTTDLNEYTVLGGYVGTWVQEGTVGSVLNNPGSFNGVTAVPYYRLYDTSTRWHHWTTDANEYYTLIQFPWWTGEGVDGYILPTTTTGATQLYRLLYPFIPGLHHWTIDPTEYGILISTYNWIGEGGSGFLVR